MYSLRVMATAVIHGTELEIRLPREFTKVWDALARCLEQRGDSATMRPPPVRLAFWYLRWRRDRRHAAVADKRVS